MKKVFLTYRKRVYSTGALLLFIIILSVMAYENHRMDDFKSYEDVTSEHYSLKKVETLGWYELVDKDANQIIGTVDCGTPILIRDESTGKLLLYCRYEDTDAYCPVVVTEELRKNLISAMGERAWFVQSSDAYVFGVDSDTGLEYLRKRESMLTDDHVLFKSKLDIDAFDILAAAYATYFEMPDVGDAFDIGEIYAEKEILGYAKRFDDGFMFFGDGGIQYAATRNPDSGWMLELTYDESNRLKEYLLTSDNPFFSCSYEDWKPVFDELNIAYDLPKGVSKKYDAQGFQYNIFGVAGMDATGKDPVEFHVLIDIPEEYRQRLFAYEKDRLITSYGRSWDDTKKQKLYRECQLSFTPEERLKCSWTLGQYDRAYQGILLTAISSQESDWQYGDEFDTSVLSGISFSDAEALINDNDGVNLLVTVSPEIQSLIDEAMWEMATPIY